MKIELAGYNVDAEEIEKLKKVEDIKEINNIKLTPEVLSAAYARISRDPDPIKEIRKKAKRDVASARKSNHNIVFKYGHSSVAEHAVLNFDISGVSRLAIEAIEKSRLVSFTEKSQRYQELKDDFIVPNELLPWEKEFIELIHKQNDAYRKIYNIQKKHLSENTNLKDVETKAKEDARYVTSLSMTGQLGMTINARNLETMISRMSAHPLKEVRDIAEQLYNEGIKIVPSLLKHIKPNKRYKYINDISKLLGKKDFKKYKSFDNLRRIDRTNMVTYIDSFGTDEEIASALLYDNLNILNTVSFPNTFDIYDAVFKNMNKFSAAPRAFELHCDRFELSISASCFAQLKRHRMATIIAKPYDISTQPIIPLSLTEESGRVFIQIMEETNKFYEMINLHDVYKEYILTQAHVRNVIIQLNARELYAFMKLRADAHAQEEIRIVAKIIQEKVKKRYPLMMKYLSGKDKFDNLKLHDSFSSMDFNDLKEKLSS